MMDFTGSGGGSLEHDKEKITIAVRKNGDFTKKESSIPPFALEHEWTLPYLLQQASKHLEMYPEADSAHNEYGDEIFNCLLLEENDIVYLLRKGEKFKMPPDAMTNAHLPTKIGKYQVGIHLGIDPMGLNVALGTEMVTGERIVLKFLARRKLRSVKQNDLIQNEIVCLQKLSHPNIIKLLSRDETRDHVVLEFELLEGGNLRQYLVARGTPMKENTAKIVLRSLVSAVSCMHMNRIIHKDLKLDNVMIKNKGDFASVQICGFHWSEVMRHNQEGLLNPGEGTLPYLPPEVLDYYDIDAMMRSHHSDDAKTSNVKGKPVDIWALGVIYFAMLQGRLPFGPNNNPDYSTGPFPSSVNNETIRSIATGHYKLSGENEGEVIGLGVAGACTVNTTGLSQEAKDLIRMMLTVNVDERIEETALISLVQEHIDTSTPASSTRDWPTAPSPITTHDSLSASGHLLCSLATLSAEVDPVLKGQVLGQHVPITPAMSQKSRNSSKNSLMSALEASRDANDSNKCSNMDKSPHLPSIMTSPTNGSRKFSGQVGMASLKIPEESSQKSNTNGRKPSFLTLEGIRSAIDQAIEGMTGGSRRPSIKSGRIEGDYGGDGDDENDDDRNPTRKKSILQALPQLFGGWRGSDKGKMAAKAKSFKGLQSLSYDQADSPSSPSSSSGHLPNINAPRRASGSHHDLVPGLLTVHSPKGAMKTSDSDPNLKAMGGLRRGSSGSLTRGMSNNNMQLSASVGGGGGERVSSRIVSSSDVGTVAVKSLKKMDNRLQDKSDSIDEHLSAAEAMIAKQNSPSNFMSAGIPGGGMIKQASISKLSASSRF